MISCRRTIVLTLHFHQSYHLLSKLALCERALESFTSRAQCLEDLSGYQSLLRDAHWEKDLPSLHIGDGASGWLEDWLSGFDTRGHTK